MSTHGVLENEIEKDRENRKIEKAENVPKEATNIATAETRAPLSYSDILKSKPSQIQVHINTVFFIKLFNREFSLLQTCPIFRQYIMLF